MCNYEDVGFGIEKGCEQRGGDRRDIGRCSKEHHRSNQGDEIPRSNIGGVE